jgi:hypothetical protein
MLGLGRLVRSSALFLSLVAIGALSPPPMTADARQCALPPAVPKAGPLTQINLRPARRGSHALGIAEVIRKNGHLSVAIAAQGLQPNTKHNAYAVWLYNSGRDDRLLGFVSPPVRSDEKLKTSGRLPNNAGCFRRLLISLETVPKPKRPHNITLSGRFEL